jgi:hypothetical protein
VLEQELRPRVGYPQFLLELSSGTVGVTLADADQARDEHVVKGRKDVFGCRAPVHVDLALRVRAEDPDPTVQELARPNLGTRGSADDLVVLVDEDGYLCCRIRRYQAGCGCGGSFASDASRASSGSEKSSILPLRYPS